MRKALLAAIVVAAFPIAVHAEDSPKLKAAKAEVDHDLPARCKRADLSVKLQAAQPPGSAEWLEIKKQLNAMARNESVRGVGAIAEGLDTDDTKSLETYYYDVMKSCPKGD